MRAANDPASDIVLRAATPADLPALLALEHRVFTSDRLSRRSLRNFLASPLASLIVAAAGADIVGYALVLVRSGSPVARLYSILIAPENERHGLGRRLLAATEDTVRERDRLFLRLEVDERNTRAIALYERAGYRRIDHRPGYYEDGGTALRMEKRLDATNHHAAAAPPYFHQTTEFTCGPACLLMALAWAGHATRAEPADEFRLWRESTTVFSGAGPGGCEPFGLAVALKRRGLAPEVFVSRPGPYFLAGLRSRERRRIVAMTQEDFLRQAHDLHIPIHLAPLSDPALMHALDTDAVVLALMSGYRLLRRKVPHWVLAFGRAGRHVLLHDPDGGGAAAGHAAGRGMAVPLQVFSRWSGYAPDALSAAVVIRKGSLQ
jgi:ribosomal protein S18 acetylase RimI-like enzyme